MIYILSYQQSVTYYYHYELLKFCLFKPHIIVFMPQCKSCFYFNSNNFLFHIFFFLISWCSIVTKYLNLSVLFTCIFWKCFPSHRFNYECRLAWTRWTAIDFSSVKNQLEIHINDIRPQFLACLFKRLVSKICHTRWWKKNCKV